MIIKIPKEVIQNKFRVGLTPKAVSKLVEKRYTVIVEKNAEAGLKLSDKNYRSCGFIIRKNSEEMFENAELIIKAKEPQKISGLD